MTMTKTTKKLSRMPHLWMGLQDHFTRSMKKCKVKTATMSGLAHLDKRCGSQIANTSELRRENCSSREMQDVYEMIFENSTQVACRCGSGLWVTTGCG